MTKPSDAGVAVLGGTAGVGLECATQFAERGARVVILGRNTERGLAAQEKVRQRAPRARPGFIQMDGMSATDTLRAEQECRELLGSIDVLICATGPSEPPQLVHDIPVEDFARRLEELIYPPLYMIQAALPSMRSRGDGAIVAVTSDAARIPTPGESLIGAAMSAITMFAKTVALEAKRENVRINILTPSLIAHTPGAELIFNSPFSAKMFTKASALAHLGLAEPADLAAMALFLTGPEARRITGQTISVNGGISVA